jgi:hypothetical protein
MMSGGEAAADRGAGDNTIVIHAFRPARNAEGSHDQPAAEGSQ